MDGPIKHEARLFLHRDVSKNPGPWHRSDLFPPGCKSSRPDVVAERSINAAHHASRSCVATPRRLGPGSEVTGHRIRPGGTGVQVTGMI